MLTKALHNILLALVALALCWLAPIYGVYDALRNRGGFWECQRREWLRWWDVYLDLRA